MNIQKPGPPIKWLGYLDRGKPRPAWNNWRTAVIVFIVITIVGASVLLAQHAFAGG